MKIAVILQGEASWKLAIQPARSPRYVGKLFARIELFSEKLTNETMSAGSAGSEPLINFT
jgi:hypothetical protein